MPLKPHLQRLSLLAVPLEQYGLKQAYSLITRIFSKSCCCSLVTSLAFQVQNSVSLLLQGAIVEVEVLNTNVRIKQHKSAELSARLQLQNLSHLHLVLMLSNKCYIAVQNSRRIRAC